MTVFAQTDANATALMREQVSKERAIQCGTEMNDYVASLNFEADFKWILPSVHREDVGDKMEDDESIENHKKLLNISDLALPPGYADICGLELPCR